MEFVLYILCCIVLVVNILPFIPHQHWFFRVWDFGRIQLLFLLGILFLLSLFIHSDFTFFSRVVQFLLLVFVGYNLKVLLPYTPLYSQENKCNSSNEENSVSIVSVNVYQFNNEYDKLIRLIDEVKPDIVLTMESNKDWEEHLRKIETNYPNTHKVTLENTYGMHFYTHLNVIASKTNYFVADDIPSFEILLEASSGKRFTFFGVHPPPPSPTEEENSKERDGELLSVAKKVKESNYPVIVSGDFNNVAWANSSVLFKKKSQLIDPRIGRGFVSTFHAKYRLLRFPIDLFFHSKTIQVNEFKTLRAIGSDHLPLFCKFCIVTENKSENLSEKTNVAEDGEIEEIIEEGKKEKGDRDIVATE